MKGRYTNAEFWLSASFTNLLISSSFCGAPVIVLIAASASPRKLNPNIKKGISLKGLRIVLFRNQLQSIVCTLVEESPTL